VNGDIFGVALAIPPVLAAKLLPAADPEKQMQWAAFLQRNALEKAQPSSPKSSANRASSSDLRLQANPASGARFADGRGDERR